MTLSRISLRSAAESGLAQPPCCKRMGAGCQATNMVFIHWAAHASLASWAWRAGRDVPRLAGVTTLSIDTGDLAVIKDLRCLCGLRLSPSKWLTQAAQEYAETGLITDATTPAPFEAFLDGPQYPCACLEKSGIPCSSAKLD